MFFRLSILFISVFISQFSFSQNDFNDTIYFKSGLVKDVEILKYDLEQITYESRSGHSTTIVTAKFKRIKGFKIYDENNQLTYSSGYEKKNSTGKTVIAQEIREDLFSVNPILLPFLSVGVNYTHRFGKDMRYGIHVPATYLSNTLFHASYPYVMVGVGPCINSDFREGTIFQGSIVPTYFYSSGKSSFGLMLGFGIIKQISNKVGLNINGGFGPNWGGNAYYSVAAKGHLGLNFYLGKKHEIKK